MPSARKTAEVFEETRRCKGTRHAAEELRSRLREVGQRTAENVERLRSTKRLWEAEYFDLHEEGHKA